MTSGDAHEKLVPDPPPVLCIREGLSLDEALYLARQHLTRAIDNAREAAEDAPLKQETLIGDSVLQIRIAQALLNVCVNHRAVVV
ncbi:hypothetical protein N7650_08575 [Pseudomonas sp. GD04058]|uniref:hypothetical protein n=1 Tax=Pseudomonas sp. GD04058 TaxID=2975429 RepID=UPI0002A220C2|nr:hypothetical protein [Pseudomonas sp. GD04058]MDG9882886.1 hypothetical protein [Pseudomonas sp. GD04058]